MGREGEKGNWNGEG